MTTMKDFIIKNNSGSEQTIDDLGITIPDATSVSSFDLGEQFQYFKLYDSDDLRSLVQAGTLTLNDGTIDLSSTEGVDYLNSVNLYELERDYYSKTELQTSGSSQVHWDNITNKPADDTTIVDGIMYINDSTRGLYLSVERHTLLFGDSGFVANRYLPVAGGAVFSYRSAQRMIRNACLVGISVQLSDVATCDVIIRRNQNSTDIFTFSLTSVQGDEYGDVNVNVDQGDFISAYVSAFPPVRNPVVTLQYAWRF